MNEATKNSIVSAVTSVLMLLGGIPAFAKFLPPDTVASLNSQVPTAVAALGTLITFGAFIYKLLPKSKESIVKGAAELPEVHQIVTTPAIANASQRPEVVAAK